MAQSDVIAQVQRLCKLYKGGEANPYNPESASRSDWANEYLKFQIWDAEYSVVRGFEWWYDTYIHQTPNRATDPTELGEDIYKFAILDKLRKMEREDIDFQAMYFSL